MSVLLMDSEDLDTCASGHSPDLILQNILRPAVNTLLKNYASVKNDSVSKTKATAKKRKLLTLI